jgi:hypothetical protein
MRGIIYNFDSFKYAPMAGGLGFQLSRRVDQPKARHRRAVVSGRDDFSFLDGERWRLGERRFQFTNVGFKNFEFHARRVNRLVLDHLKKDPEDNLTVYLSPDFQEAARLAEHRRWAIHDAVLDRYYQKKFYLKGEDYVSLVDVNRLSDNSDVLVVTDAGSGVPIGEMSKRQLNDNLLLTIQISYFGDEVFFVPDLRKVALDSGLTMRSDDRFPFEFRIRKDLQQSFRRQFFEDFDPRTTCEFLRYALLGSDVPRAVHDRMLSEAVALAAKRGMKTIVASADAVTARLFRRYGFKPYKKLPVEQSEVDEYLVFARMDDPEFRAAFRRTEEQGAAVYVVRR